jgi:hypothetical protein
MNWPNDADGEVLRSLENGGFDFRRRCLIDFNVDFEEWPPSSEAMSLLAREYPSLKVSEPDAGSPGYLQFQVYGILDYEVVTRVQESVSESMAVYKGRCDSWGVLHDPAS